MYYYTSKKSIKSESRKSISSLSSQPTSSHMGRLCNHVNNEKWIRHQHFARADIRAHTLYESGLQGQSERIYTKQMMALVTYSKPWDISIFEAYWISNEYFTILKLCLTRLQINFFSNLLGMVYLVRIFFHCFQIYMRILLRSHCSVSSSSFFMSASLLLL